MLFGIRDRGSGDKTYKPILEPRASTRTHSSIAYPRPLEKTSVRTIRLRVISLTSINRCLFTRQGSIVDTTSEPRISFERKQPDGVTIRRHIIRWIKAIRSRRRKRFGRIHFVRITVRYANCSEAGQPSDIELSTGWKLSLLLLDGTSPSFAHIYFWLNIVFSFRTSTRNQLATGFWIVQLSETC